MTWWVHLAPIESRGEGNAAIRGQRASGMLARAPGIHLILGGHEHENAHRRVFSLGGVPEPLPSIFRADANALTVYVHVLTYNMKHQRLERVESQLRLITDAVAEDPVVAAIAKQWNDRAYPALRDQGYDPEEKLAIINEPLDGKEASVRWKETSLTQLIGEAMLRAHGATDRDTMVAMYNGGSVRIDDILYPGQVTMFDVLRILPFPGGAVHGAKLKGEDLKKILDKKVRQVRGDKDQGQKTGAFLQTRNVNIGKAPDWTIQINGKQLDPRKTYDIAINSYLLEGREKGFEFVKDLPFADTRDLGDWRHIIADEFRRMKGTPTTTTADSNGPAPVPPTTTALAKHAAKENPGVVVTVHGATATAQVGQGKKNNDNGDDGNGIGRTWIWITLTVVAGVLVVLVSVRVLFSSHSSATSAGNNGTQVFEEQLWKAEELALSILLAALRPEERSELITLAVSAPHAAIARSWSLALGAQQGKLPPDIGRLLSLVDRLRGLLPSDVSTDNAAKFIDLCIAVVIASRKATQAPPYEGPAIPT